MVKRFLLTLIITILVLTGGVTAQSDSTIQVMVDYAGDIQPIMGFQKNRITYFSLSQLAEIIGGDLDWNLVGHSLFYQLPENRFEFVLGSPFFKLNTDLFNITYPARLEKGQLLLPAETFIPFLDRILQQQLTWNTDTHTLKIESQYFNVTDFKIEHKANGLLIDIFLTRELTYDIAITEGNWINVFITDGRVNTGQIVSQRDSRYMYKLTAHQGPGSAQVSMRMKKPVEQWQHRLATDPPRIEITIVDASFEVPENADTAPKVGPDNKIDVIVVDAGHGGDDYGAVGPGKTREKDIVLGIAKELAGLIRKDKQFKVIMTRGKDDDVSLEQRAKIANDAGADLFISIHANASPKRDVRGWNVFFLAAARNDSARAVAQFENSFFMREQSTLNKHRGEEDEETDVDPVMSILNEMIMTEFQTESHDFAMMIAKEFHRDLKIPARGVDQAGFFVLNKVYTPSVLVESGFISNKTEEKLLKTSSYQKTVAEAIYKAIKKFKAQYEAD
ncbi:MAG TPA: N-acetylmuramoyl-L-alanine amidase [candidate division Zixibacteria bacterium]|nr:N-acetylmuramoyl-L-alanine amidase [candidate division Zixibacteria bacterium]